MQKNNPFPLYLSILATMFVLIFITRGVYYSFVEKLDTKTQSEQQVTDLKDELDRVNALKKSFETKDGENGKLVGKYISSFSEDAIIDYLFDYSAELLTKEETLIFTNISLSEPKKNKYGFLESDMSIGFKTNSTSTMRNFLDFLVAEESKYAFFLDSFTYPEIKDGVIEMTLPVKIFTIEK